MTELKASESPGFRPLKIEKMTLSVAETARLLGVSRSLVYRMIKSGAIPSLRLSSRILVPKNRLCEIVENAHNYAIPDSQHTIAF